MAVAYDGGGVWFGFVLFFPTPFQDRRLAVPFIFVLLLLSHAGFSPHGAPSTLRLHSRSRRDFLNLVILSTGSSWGRGG